MLISLVARRALDYEGSVIPAGTRFDATPLAAAVLRYQRLAEFAPPGFPEAPVPVAAPEPDPVTPTPKRRGRPPRAKPSPTDDETPPSPRRRQYRRRNLTAEP